MGSQEISTNAMRYGLGNSSHRGLARITGTPRSLLPSSPTRVGHTLQHKPYRQRARSIPSPPPGRAQAPSTGRRSIVSPSCLLCVSDKLFSRGSRAPYVVVTLELLPRRAPHFLCTACNTIHTRDNDFNASASRAHEPAPRADGQHRQYVRPAHRGHRATRANRASQSRSSSRGVAWARPTSEPRRAPPA
jgi:hypothetical protein